MMITIITVCYNAEKEIEKTMLSVLQQTYTDVEYIIIDGLSKDKTLEVIEAVKRRFPLRNIRVISEPDNGIYDAMNKGVSLANGEWLNMMNAGDVFASKDVLRRVTESGLMEQSSFIYSDFIAADGDKRRLIKQDYDKGKILHQSSIYKRELHDKYGYYYVTHPYIVSDYLFFLQIPREQFAKFNSPISMNDASGVSMQGYWMEYGRISVDYMMRRVTEEKFICQVLLRYCINRIKDFLKLLK